MPVEGTLSDDDTEPLALIETLRWSAAEGFVRLDRHLRRLAESAEIFGIPFNAADVIELLRCSVSGDPALRVRLVFHSHGRMNCETAPFEIEPEWHGTLSTHRVQSDDPMLRHKTSRRALFTGEQKRIAALGLHEVIFLNERGEITQGSRSNVFARVGGRLVTPPLHCGLLNGCLRRELIESGACAESVLTPEDIIAASEFYLGNSLRGLIPAALIRTDT